MTRGGQPGVRWRIEDVLDRTDLAALLDHLAEPATHTMRGRRWHCPLPEHEDHHASVTMHTDHRGHERWRCWSGDDTHRGDAIDLAAATQRLSRAEAIDWLAQRAGMIPDQPLSAAPARRPRPTTPTVVPLDPAVTRYAAACERILWSPSGRPVRDWLHQRGLDDDVLRVNHVGADPGRRMMRRQRGLPYGNGIAAVFPALDPTGNVRYLQARYLEPGDGPKYDNPAGALGSNPRLAWTRTDRPTRPGVLVVCEGIPDALTAAQAGYTAVGILGSQAPDHSVAARLATHAESHDLAIVAIIDNDAAGRAWGQRLGDLLAEHDHHLAIIEPPEAGLDLNAWALTDADWFRDLHGSQRQKAPSLDPIARRTLDRDVIGLNT
ncbi:MAG: toprim domain-containing protein [Mycolicibacterium neoaurum]|nr:toprim domain-containing protein [Mycolicibacterium neoaurum]